MSGSWVTSVGHYVPAREGVPAWDARKMVEAGQNFRASLKEVKSVMLNVRMKHPACAWKARPFPIRLWEAQAFDASAGSFASTLRMTPVESRPKYLSRPRVEEKREDMKT
jgi:hypothetical protein